MFEPETGIIFWTGVTFALLLLALYTIALPPLLQILQKRKQAIEGSIRQGEETRRQAEALLASYRDKLAGVEQQASSLIERAKTASEQMRAVMIKNAEDEIRTIREQIKQEAAAEKHQVLVEIRQELTEVVICATSKVLGREITGKDQQRMIKQEIDSLAKF